MDKFETVDGVNVKDETTALADDIYKRFVTYLCLSLGSKSLVADSTQCPICGAHIDAGGYVFRYKEKKYSISKLYLHKVQLHTAYEKDKNLLMLMRDSDFLIEAIGEMNEKVLWTMYQHAARQAEIRHWYGILFDLERLISKSEFLLSVLLDIK